MADKKISQLTALSAANVASATDVLAIVDTSATETKKITAKDLIDGALNGGTANGVLYLNGSKVATSGSALTFDGAILGVNGVSVGRGAGAVSTNTAVGASALAANTSGSVNAAFGSNSLASNTSGGGNTAFGPSSLQNNTTGSSNTGLGYLALTSNTTGSFNIAVGQQALNANTTASSNTAVGYQSLYSNTTGYDNTANGVSALYFNTTGSANTANGANALYANTTGSINTANGVNALYANTTGNSNTAIGLEAGYGDGTQANTTGDNNTFIGYDAMGASATASNVITLGNASIATLRCQVTTITSLSDARDKTNIVDIPAGLSFVQALRPVSFDWNMRNGKKVGIQEFGFIAQDLQQAQVEQGVTVPNLVSTENPDKLEASAGTLIPVLVKAIQELKAEFDAYKASHP